MIGHAWQLTKEMGKVGHENEVNVQPYAPKKSTIEHVTIMSSVDHSQLFSSEDKNTIDHLEIEI